MVCELEVSRKVNDTLGNYAISDSKAGSLLLTAKIYKKNWKRDEAKKNGGVRSLWSVERKWPVLFEHNKKNFLDMK